MNKVPTLLASALLLTACVSWPPERGGSAGNLSRCEAPAPSVTRQQLCLDFCRARYALVQLKQQGAETCLPAQWQYLEQQLHLARQEFDGELELSAQQRVKHVLHNLPALESRLNYLKANTPCQVHVAADTPPAPQLRQWQDQLAVDRYSPAFFERQR